MENSTNKPVESYRARGVSVSIFRNEPKSGSPFYKVALQRVYKDGDEFKTTNSLGRDDLPVARMLLQRAWEYIVDAESGSRE